MANRMDALTADSPGAGQRECDADAEGDRSERLRTEVPELAGGNDGQTGGGGERGLCALAQRVDEEVVSDVAAVGVVEVDAAVAGEHSGVGVDAADPGLQLEPA